MTTSKLSLLHALTVLGLTFLPATSKAEDFNFVVPVNVSHLPGDIDVVGVTCVVYGTVGGMTTEIGSGGTLATSMPLVGGAFHGDVTISFNAHDGRDPHAGSTYQCTLGMSHNGLPALLYFGERSTFYHPYPDWRTFPLQSGAPFADSTGAQPLPHS